MSRFSDIARRSVDTRGGVTGGLEKVNIDDIIRAYPNGITITGVDRISYDGDYFYSFIFAEDPSKCFSGGKALREIADNWFDACDDDADEVNAELAAEHVRLKMEKIRTKNNRSFTKVTVLGSVRADDEPRCNPDTGEIVDPPFI